MSEKVDIIWIDMPQEHDYPAVKSYLNLLYEDAKAAAYAEQLRKAPMGSFKANDILRACALPLLGLGNVHVDKDRKKILAGDRISPLLLVRQPGTRGLVADGYHRLCAVYGIDEDAVIPCKKV